MSKQENVVQGALVAALEVYADRHWVHSDVFEPYANQQGSRDNQYCADVVARLSQSRLILLEVKELDWIQRGKRGRLPAYSSVQHHFDWFLESRGVPIFYAYASVDSLSYLQAGRERQWPNTTLINVHLSRPSELFLNSAQHLAAEPNLQAHTTLLNWILAEPGADGLAATLMTHVLSMGARQLRNRVLVASTATSGGVQLTAWPGRAIQEILAQAYALATPWLEVNLPRDPDDRNPDKADEVLRDTWEQMRREEGEIRRASNAVEVTKQVRSRGGPDLPQTDHERIAEERLRALIGNAQIRAPKSEPDLER